MTDLDLGGSLDGWDDELNDWTEDDRVRDQRIEAARHQRSVCCPDDPTCPWPDSCAECGEDWPCTAIGEARERAMSHLPQTDAKLRLDAEREAVELNGGCMCPMGADVCHCGAEQRIAKFAAADAALERHRVRRGICIRDRPEGGVCNQGYDHTGHCDWWSSPAVTDALASIQPNPRIERAQAAYNAALLDELPPMVVDWEAERRAGLVDRSHHDD